MTSNNFCYNIENDKKLKIKSKKEGGLMGFAEKVDGLLSGIGVSLILNSLSINITEVLNSVHQSFPVLSFEISLIMSFISASLLVYILASIIS